MKSNVARYVFSWDLKPEKIIVDMRAYENGDWVKYDDIKQYLPDIPEPPKEKKIKDYGYGGANHMKYTGD